MWKAIKVRVGVEVAGKKKWRIYEEKRRKLGNPELLFSWRREVVAVEHDTRLYSPYDYPKVNQVGLKIEIEFDSDRNPNEQDLD